jgi:glycosyltransferase involved in cell wall biosynthesis
VTEDTSSISAVGAHSKLIEMASMHSPATNSAIQRTKILLLVPRLGDGGAEHVISLLARGVSRKKYETHLGIVSASHSGAASLPRWVTVHILNSKRARAGALPLLRLAWRVRPDVILSGASEVSFLTLLLRPLFPPRARVLIRQNGTVSCALTSGNVPPYTRWLYCLLYRRADRVICQSSAMAEDLARELGIDERHVTVLPNPVDIDRIRAASNAPAARMGPGPHLLAVGRLVHAKGFDLLIEALATVRMTYPGADLIIAGSGAEEATLKLLCRSLCLESAVSFAGHVDPVFAFYPGTTLFVLSSRYEGMPNALLEAAAAGLPLVATPASGGIADLLSGQLGAWLATEVSAQSLSAAIVTALGTIQPGERFHHQYFPSAAD